MARQLGQPSGVRGRWVVSGLNRRNRKTIDTAVAELGEGSGLALADVGFGGGIGLRILLDRPETRMVEGIDISPTAVGAAERTYGNEVSTGRLRLH
jgi:methylase of polypeptide subunit release factors